MDDGTSDAPPLPPSLRQQLRSDASCYCSCYCEENVLQLAQHPAALPLLPPSEPVYVCLISNAQKQVAVRHQHAGAGRPDRTVVWDYHVVLLTRRIVLDVDSTLPFPTPTADYFAASFSGVSTRYAPRFRLVPLLQYRAFFASDRRHMRRDDGGGYMSPPPPWPCFTGSGSGSGSGSVGDSAHTLDALLHMEAGAGEALPGRALGTVPDLLTALSAAEGCREALKQALHEIKAKYGNSTSTSTNTNTNTNTSTNSSATGNKRMAILLSGGVDTAAIMECNERLLPAHARLPLAVAVAVFATPDATDRPYCALLRTRHASVEHHSVDTTLEGLLQALPACVHTLRTFDGMTLRNSLVIALAMQRAKALGADVVVTGDGADELLGGYSYTWGTEDEAAWVAKRNELALTMSFATAALAAAAGLEAAVSPYLQPSFVAWATSATGRRDCVAERGIELAPGAGRSAHQTGKVTCTCYNCSLRERVDG